MSIPGPAAEPHRPLEGASAAATGTGPARAPPTVARCVLCAVDEGTGEGHSGQKRWREEVAWVLGAAGGSWSLSLGWEGTAVGVVQGQDWRPTASCHDPWLGEPEPLHLTADTFLLVPLALPQGRSPTCTRLPPAPCPASLPMAAALSGLLRSAPLFPASPPLPAPVSATAPHLCPAGYQLRPWCWAVPPLASRGAQLSTSASPAGTRGLLTQQALSTSGQH